MEGKQKKPPSTANQSALDIAEKRLAKVLEDVLPQTPHIITMPKKHQIDAQYQNEHRNLFGFKNQAEFEAMQYMTLVTPTNGERGNLIETRGNWEEEVAALTAQNGSRSGSGTPAPAKTFTSKISFNAYKKNGMKAPLSATGTPDFKPGHSRTGSGVSVSATGMARVGSSEGFSDARSNRGRADADISRDIPRSSVNDARYTNEQSRSASTTKPTGPPTHHTHTPTSSGQTRTQSRTTAHEPAESSRAKPTASSTMNASRKETTSNGSYPSSTHRNSLQKPDKSRSQERLPSSQSKFQEGSSMDRHTPNVNGSSSQDMLQDTPTNREPSRRDQYEGSRGQNPLPRRPSPPPTGSSQRTGHLKRSADSSIDQPEKRSKVDHLGSSNNSRTPLESRNTLPRKPLANGLPAKPPPSAIKSTSTPRPNALGQALGAGYKGKTNTPKLESPRYDTPRDLPPLLSPLHTNLESSPLPGPASTFNKKKSENIEDERRARPLTSVPKRKSDEDTSSGKKRARGSESPERKRRLGGLPKLLSPDLPDFIDKALGELKEDKKKVATVEERHELARRPDAKGVARKTVKVRGAGKGPRRKSAQPSEPLSDAEESEEEQGSKQSLIVVLKYKRKASKTVERILRITPRPKAGNKSKAERPSLKASAIPKGEESSDEDIPLARSSAPQKRPATSVKSELQEKNNKKTSSTPSQSSTSITVSAARTSAPARHESPAPSAVNNKNLLATPKKGDAMKSVSMLRVDSADGQSRTPQPVAISTPSSASRSAVPDTRPPNPEAEKIRSFQAKCGQLALNAKRKMDSIIRHKERPRPEIPEKDHKLGIATGLEAMIMYMNSHAIAARANSVAGTRTHSRDSWYNVMGLMSWLESESRNFPVTHALLLHISAMCKEFYERELVEAIAKDPKDMSNIGKLTHNSSARTNDWLEAEKEKQALVPHGGLTFIGPGMDIKAVTDYTLGVLTAQSRAEKTGWKKDAQFGSFLTSYSAA